LKPFVERVDQEGEPLERFVHDLTQAAALADKAKRIDASGSLGSELERLLAQAAERGLEGAGPRDWLRELRDGLENGRPAGKPSDEAINLLTAHSAKGLEWPVVIPFGLWREIGKRTETGLRLLPDEAGGMRVFFDHASLTAATRDARERERQRELVRLLYVTLTRARRALVLPKGEVTMEGSFLELWGADLAGLPPVTEIKWEAATTQVTAALAPTETAAPSAKGIAIPRRILPHQLAQKPDVVRAVRHESAGDEAAWIVREDPVEYGVWWHEAVEFLPWSGPAGAREDHLRAALLAAEKERIRRTGEAGGRLVAVQPPVGRIDRGRLGYLRRTERDGSAGDKRVGGRRHRSRRAKIWHRRTVGCRLEDQPAPAGGGEPGIGRAVDGRISPTAAGLRELPGSVLPGPEDQLGHLLHGDGFSRG